jgi:hypothetical protein
MAMHLAVLAKLSRTNPSARRADLGLPARQLWAISAGASVWLIDLEPYEKCRVVGVVKRLSVDPHHGYIEVTINDGTGQVAARWAIRAHAPQLALAPRTAVVLDGVAVVGDDGRLTLVEPGFETITYLASE